MCFQKFDVNVIGIDLSDNMIVIALERLAELNEKRVCTLPSYPPPPPPPLPPPPPPSYRPPVKSPVNGYYISLQKFKYERFYH